MGIFWDSWFRLLTVLPILKVRSRLKRVATKHWKPSKKTQTASERNPVPETLTPRGESDFLLLWVIFCSGRGMRSFSEGARLQVLLARACFVFAVGAGALFAASARVHCFLFLWVRARLLQVQARSTKAPTAKKKTKLVKAVARCDVCRGRVPSSLTCCPPPRSLHSKKHPQRKKQHEFRNVHPRPKTQSPENPEP